MGEYLFLIKIVSVFVRYLSFTYSVSDEFSIPKRLEIVFLVGMTVVIAGWVDKDSW